MALAKIDLHSHLVPPFYREALLRTGHEHPDGMPEPPQWSEETHLEFHAKLNITKSILSVSSPGTHLTPGKDAEARELTRKVNEFSAEIKRRQPGHFGFFASLPLPDVEGALDEISYVTKHLNADGFVLMTNHHGHYVGDKKFDPVFDELNRHKAIVFIHPTTPCTALPGGGCAHAIPLARSYPRPMFEFFFDSTRAYTNLFLSGTVARCPNITFIVTHAAGTLPPLVTRIGTIPALLELENCDPNANAEFIKERLNSEQFFYDLAGWPFPLQIQGLLALLDQGDASERLVYGSDYPWTKMSMAVELGEDLDKQVTRLCQHNAKAVCDGNAQRLLEWKGDLGRDQHRNQ